MSETYSEGEQEDAVVATPAPELALPTDLDSKPEIVQFCLRHRDPVTDRHVYRHCGCERCLQLSLTQDRERDPGRLFYCSCADMGSELVLLWASFHGVSYGKKVYSDELMRMYGPSRKAKAESTVKPDSPKSKTSSILAFFGIRSPKKAESPKPEAKIEPLVVEEKIETKTPEIKKAEIPDLKIIKDPTARLKFSINLESEARKYLTLCKVINDCSALANPAFLEVAFHRTSKFLELQAEHPDEILVPALDIMAVWSSLMLRNDKYLTYLGLTGKTVDCKECFVLGADGEVVAGDHEHTKNHLGLTRELWKARFEEEYLVKIEDLLKKVKEPTSTKDTETAEQETKEVPVLRAYDVKNFLSVEDVIKDRNWYVEQEKTFGLDSSQVLKSSVKSYENWIYICSRLQQEIGDYKYGETAIERYVNPEVDIMWHTHLIHPSAYEKDCLSYVGTVLVHNPWPKLPDEELYRKGLTLFEEYSKKVLV